VGFNYGAILSPETLLSQLDPIHAAEENTKNHPLPTWTALAKQRYHPALYFRIHGTQINLEPKERFIGPVLKQQRLTALNWI
jgi:hypothetical protein